MRFKKFFIENDKEYNFYVPVFNNLIFKTFCEKSVN